MLMCKFSEEKNFTLRLKLILICLLSLFVVPCGSGLALAHPVAQGHLDLIVEPEAIRAELSISTEQFLVERSKSPIQFGDPMRLHGAYLTKHLHIFAQGVELVPMVTELPESSRNLKAGVMPVVLTYSVPSDLKAPIEFQELTVTQDFLREYEFAPGNLWEATLLVDVKKDDVTLAAARLLTYSEPLVIDLKSIPEIGKLAGLSIFDIVKDYLNHGIHHILSGYDHLLFVSALVLAVTTAWELIIIISVFTLAHTCTLILSFYDIVRLPSSIVEPMIAASIVCVALQNLIFPKSAQHKSRLMVAFFFGLFHGLGFAGGLLESMGQLPPMFAIWALASFSIGVEIGHQIVVWPLLLTLRFIQSSSKNEVKNAIARCCSGCIAVAGLYYFIAALSA